MHRGRSASSTRIGRDGVGSDAIGEEPQQGVDPLLVVFTRPILTLLA